MGLLGKILFPLLLLAVLLAGGCWDSRELQNLGIILGAGIDVVPPEERTGGEKIRLTIEIANVAEGAAQKGNHNINGFVFSSMGATLSEAVYNLSNMADKQLFWGQTQVLLFGEGALAEGVNQYLEYFLRDQRVHPTVRLAAVSGSAGDYFRAGGGVSDIFSFGFNGILQSSAQGGVSTVRAVTMQDYLEALSAPGGSPVLPYAVLNGESDGGRAAQGEGGQEEEGGETEESVPQVCFDGMMVLSGKGAAAALLGKEGSLGMMIWRGWADDFLLAAETDDGERLVFEVSDCRVRKKWQSGAQGLELWLDVSLKANFREAAGEKNYGEVAAAEALQGLLDRETARLLLSCWDNSLALGEDYLLAGSHLRRYNYQEWRKTESGWPAAMREVTLRVEVKSHVYR